MKKIIIVLAVLLSANLSAQIHDPVKWSTSVEKLSGTEYKLVAVATIESGWHLYSQDVPEDGPIETSFTYDDESGVFKIVGNTSEEEGHTIDDPIFKMKIKFFENKATFKQKIKIIGTKTTVNAFVEFTVCDDTQCLPPTEVDLVFDLTKATASLSENAVSISKDEHSLQNKTKEQEKVVTKEPIENSKNNQSLWTLFILSFFAGFAALLTPCVFPMIPMTVSFFTKQSKTKAIGVRNSIIFGLSIIILYVLLGVVVTKIFGADALNALATNVWFNVVFFVLLIVFAVSFLGAFEIMLPNLWANKVDAKADKGG
ncbi:MAG: protein-disulfide reductase DsbD domain-containing protein, partial [Flavobacteriaceae bacterium]